MTIDAVASSVNNSFFSNYVPSSNTTTVSYSDYLNAITQANNSNTLLGLNSSNGSSNGDSTSSNSLLNGSFLDLIDLSPAALGILQSVDNFDLLNGLGSTAATTAATPTVAQNQLNDALQNLGLNSKQQAQVVAVVEQFTNQQPVSQTSLSQAETQNEVTTANNSQIPGTPATPTDTTTQEAQLLLSEQEAQQNNNIAYADTYNLQQSYLSGYVQQPVLPANRKFQDEL